MVERTRLGTSPGDPLQQPAPIDQLTLRSPAGIAIEVLTLGATLRTVRVPDRSGGTVGVTAALDDVDAYADRNRSPYLGATVGRWANRIAGARFTLDDAEVRLDANEGDNQLHGGPHGFDRRVWSADGEDRPDGGAVRLELTSPDGDQGFPGTVTTTATYELVGDVVRITYEATTDAPTVVSLTNHTYWNLAGTGTIHDHDLAVHAARYLPVDDETIPLADAPAGLDGTPYDLRDARRIGDVLGELGAGIDHCYVITPEQLGPGDAPVRPAARLLDRRSGRWMELATDQPGMQVYTGEALGPPLRTHGGLALETQRLPDAPNRRDLGPAVLRPGERYLHRVELRFGG
ncbi:MAG: aldose epimerase family protein [Actinomycetota bacterium]|nr:aldose epimerase family protein [Actinomycetota bacterium]